MRHSCRRHRGSGRRNRPRLDRQLDARVLPWPQDGAALGQAEREAFDESAVAQRIGAVGAPAQQGHSRQKQDLREREQVGVAVVGRSGQAECFGEGARQQRVGAGHRAELAIVGAGQDDRRERAQHGARQRRDDDIDGRRRAVRVERIGREEGLALEHVADPPRKVGEQHRLKVVGQRLSARGLERRIDAESGKRLAAGRVVAQSLQGTGAIEGSGEGVEPADQGASRHGREGFGDIGRVVAQRGSVGIEVEPGHTLHPGDLGPPTRRFERCQRAATTRGAPILPAGAAVLGTGHRARRPASCRTWWCFATTTSCIPSGRPATSR